MSKDIPISLVMDDGLIPSPDGIKYTFRHGIKKDYNIWEVVGYNDTAFYVFSDYPTGDILDDIKETYRDEEWFDPDEMDLALQDGYDINLPKIYVENKYKLPYQNVVFRDGRVYALDEETGEERELSKMSICVQDDSGNWIGHEFLIFTKNVIWNKAMAMNLIHKYDMKIPQDVRTKWDKIWHYMSKNNDYEIQVNDVYVLTNL